VINRYIWWRHVAQQSIIVSLAQAILETSKFGGLSDEALDNLEAQTKKPLAIKAYDLRSWLLLVMWVLVLVGLAALSCI